MWSQLERKGKTHNPSLFLVVGTQQARKPIFRRAVRAPSLVPNEARRTRRGSFDRREPASPRITCLGEIKDEKIKQQQQEKDEGRESRFGSCFGEMIHIMKEKGKLRKQSGEEEKDGGVWDGDKHQEKQSSSLGVVPEKSNVPTLGELRLYTSGRRELQSFDWRIAAVTSRDDMSRG